MNLFKKDQKSKTVVVLGMHRSGTSVVSAILSELGVNMGDELLEANQFNTTGHFEDKGFIELNNEILESVNATWVNPPKQGQLQNISETLKKQVENQVQLHSKGLWGWKDPRTSLTIELFYPYLENPYFIVCYRDENEVAASINKREPEVPVEHGVELKKHYDLVIENFFNNHEGLKRFNINYKDLLDNPKGYVEHFVNFLEIKAKPETIEKATALVEKKS